MKFSSKIYKAINIAAHLHDGQERKGDGLPYIVHPFAVALILLEHTSDEDVLIAGILHDTIEDTTYTKEQMEQDFGQRITQFVLDVTEPPKPLPWQQRKDGYLQHLAGASYEAKLICAADKLHNLQSMLDAVQKFGEEAYKRFNAPIDKKLWFYEKCIKILKSDEKMPKEITKAIEALLEAIKTLDTPKLTRKILFVECENDGCGFGVEFKHLNETFFFCKDCKSGVNTPNEQLKNFDHICGGCKNLMEKYELNDEDNVCPICNDMLSVCYTGL